MLACNVVDRQVRGRHGRAGSKLRSLSNSLMRFHIVYARFVYRLGRWPFTPERGVRFPYRVPQCPGGVMVATLVLEASGEIRVGSSPTWGTKFCRVAI